MLSIPGSCTKALKVTYAIVHEVIARNLYPSWPQSYFPWIELPQNSLCPKLKLSTAKDRAEFIKNDNGMCEIQLTRRSILSCANVGSKTKKMLEFRHGFNIMFFFQKSASTVLRNSEMYWKLNKFLKLSRFSLCVFLTIIVYYAKRNIAIWNSICKCFSTSMTLLINWNTTTH